jgi:MoaA/NifB/PqqE/SkfB family radical SAM enzyme
MILNYRSFFWDGISLLLKLTPGRLWNYIKLALSYHVSVLTQKPRVCGLPFSVSFETSAICNLKCPECALGTGNTIRRNKSLQASFISMQLEALRKQAFYCNLYFQGEPFLNPQIIDIIRMTKSYGYYSVISTNGHFLSEDHCHKILSGGLNKLIISLDGIDESTYEKYRKGGDFNLVISGIRRICAMKKEKKSRYPLIVVQFLVNKANEHQLSAAGLFVRDLGADILEFKSMQIYSEEGLKDFKPEADKYNRYHITRKLTKRKRCFRLWSHVVFTSDGIMVPCCFDKKPDHPISPNGSGILEGWRSKDFMTFRHKVITGIEMPEICSNCLT